METVSRKSDTLDMTQGPVLRPLFSYTLPIIFSSVLSLMFNAVDMIVVGQFVGEASVAAVGSSSSLIGFTTNLFIGISMGATVKLTTDIGAGKKDHTKTIQTAYTMGIICGIITSVIGCSLSHTMLVWMNTPAEVLPLATRYLRIYFLGQLGFMVFSFERAILSAFGDTRSPFYYLTISGVINVLLNLAFVLVFHLGVAGVAIATVISQYISAVLTTRKLRRLPGENRLYLKKLCLNGEAAKRILYLGIPSGIQTTLYLFSTVMIQSSVNSLGSTSLVAGNSAAVNLESFVNATMTSIAQGCIAFSGQNYGARNVKRLRRVYRSSIFLEIAIAASLGILACLFGRQLLGLYLPDSEAGVQFGLARMYGIMPIYFLCGIMDCTTYMIRGMNRTIFPLVATCLGSIAFRILWIYTLFAWARDTMASMPAYRILLLSYPVSWIITFAVLLIYYFMTIRDIKRENSAIENKEIYA